MVRRMFLPFYSKDRGPPRIRMQVLSRSCCCCFCCYSFCCWQLAVSAVADLELPVRLRLHDVHSSFVWPVLLLLLPLQVIRCSLLAAFAVSSVDSAAVGCLRPLLQVMGTKGRRFYKIVAANQRDPRDGKHMEVPLPLLSL